MCEIDGMDCGSVRRLVGITYGEAEDTLELLCLAILSISEKIHDRLGWTTAGIAQLHREVALQSLLEFVSVNEKKECDRRAVCILLNGLLRFRRDPIAISHFLEKVDMDVPLSIRQLV